MRGRRPTSAQLPAHVLAKAMPARTWGLSEGMPLVWRTALSGMRPECKVTNPNRLMLHVKHTTRRAWQVPRTLGNAPVDSKSLARVKRQNMVTLTRCLQLIRVTV